MKIICPDCNGDCEHYRGQSSPDDDGYEPCKLCAGEGNFDPIERIRALIEGAEKQEAMYYELLGRAQEAGINLAGIWNKTGD
jgi:DnaJ-class molecular chaperone